MNNAFKISLGIAAIDCLISAFVAILVVTISIIGTAEQGSALDVSKTVILSLKKSEITSSRMRIRLLIVIDLGGNELIAIAPALTGTGLVPISGAEKVTADGSLYWRD